MVNKLIIIDNESIFKDEFFFYCDNIESKTLSEGLKENFDISLIGRKSKKRRSYKINSTNVVISTNIIQFLINIFKNFKEKNVKYLLISISPYTFFASILLLIFRKKFFVYLRSNGYEEYKAILGFIGPLIFHFMYLVVTAKSNIICCQKRLVNKNNYDLVLPSELDDQWIATTTKPLLDKARILYVGRIKVEKGIFSLLQIFEKIPIGIELSLVGKSENLKINNKKINLLGFVNNTESLIKIYDNHNITILPSFTEAHPKVIDESLARERPIIIFDEIDHIVQNRKGIFVAKRNVNSLSEKIEFIMKNYQSIQNEIKKNKLPTKQEFISQFSRILS